MTTWSIKVAPSLPKIHKSGVTFLELDLIDQTSALAQSLWMSIPPIIKLNKYRLIHVRSPCHCFINGSGFSIPPRIPTLSCLPVWTGNSNNSRQEATLVWITMALNIGVQILTSAIPLHNGAPCATPPSYFPHAPLIAIYYCVQYPQWIPLCFEHGCPIPS